MQCKKVFNAVISVYKESDTKTNEAAVKNGIYMLRWIKYRPL